MTPTKQQATAIHAKAPLIFCLAGPGTGKTTTLLARILADIERGIDPASMVCITYTRAAAKEFVERCPELKRLHYVGTLHGFCLRLIQRQGGPMWSIIDEDTAMDLLKAKAAALSIRACTLKDMVRAKTNGAGPSSPAGLVAAAYAKEMIANRTLDFDLILTRALAILRAPGAPKFSAVYVDEAQDSAPIDLLIYQALNTANLFVVADPDQSMYSFRGAEPLQFLRWCTTPGAFTCYLEQCQRCVPLICEAAYRLISHNRSRPDKRLVSARNEPMHAGQMQHFESGTEATELAAISARIGALQNQGVPLSQIAVLARHNATVAGIAERLIGSGLAVATTPPPLPEDWVIVMAALNALIDPTNDYASAGWRNRVMVNGHHRLRAMAEVSKCSLTQALLKSQGITPDMEPIQALHMMAVPPACLVTLRAVWQGDALTTRDMMLERAQQAENAQGEAVTVCTVHAAKGREWDHVIIAAAEQGLMPGNKTGQELEEERRIFYVATTRARNSVLITSAKVRRNQWTKIADPMTPSQFITELA